MASRVYILKSAEKRLFFKMNFSSSLLGIIFLLNWSTIAGKK